MPTSRVENAVVAERLGISAKAVQYIRPRLLSDYYAGDIADLLQSVKRHLDNCNQSIVLFTSLLASTKPKHVKNQEKYLANQVQTKSNRELYQEIIFFLESLTEEQRVLLME